MQGLKLNVQQDDFIRVMRPFMPFLFCLADTLSVEP
jgi:hypothetical protein